MSRYGKRGAGGDAFRWAGEGSDAQGFDDEDRHPWFRDLVILSKIRYRDIATEQVTMLIDPPSGKGAPLVASVGDWVVRNARGDVFPMTPEKFAATYEAVSGWIVCAERLPEMTYHDGDTKGVVRSGEVLAYALGEIKLLDLIRVHIDVDTTWEGVGPDEMGTSFPLGEVTHWRPLPEPPK